MPRKAKTSPPANPTDWLARFPSLKGIPKLKGTGPTVDDVESEMATMPHLTDDIAHNQAAAGRREFRDARQLDTAIAALGSIPAQDETRHMVISGKFALWDFVSAILALAAPSIIDTLTIATLGFSKLNITEAGELIDAGKIGKLNLLCSHYFKGTSTEIYDHAAAIIAARPDRSRFLSIRTHAKILAILLSDRRTITIESSANLRSCKNIETATAFGDPKVYDFHVRWINKLFYEAKHGKQ